MSKLFFVFAVLFSVHAGAANVRFVKEKGKPLTAIWPSGNEAQLKMGGGSILTTPIEFKVTENSCRSDIGQKFTGRFPLTGFLMIWMWSKHADEKRVGVPLKKGGDTLADVLIFTNGTHFRFPDLGANLPMDRIGPNDFSFIPGMEGPFREFTIDQWLSESMAFNPETGVMENRIVFNGSGVHVNSEGYIAGFDSVGEGGKGGRQLALIGDVVTWMVNTPQNMCIVTFKPDLGPAREMLGKYLTSIKGPFTPYDWESDSISIMLDEIVESPIHFRYVEAADE